MTTIKVIQIVLALLILAASIGLLINTNKALKYAKDLFKSISGMDYDEYTKTLKNK